MKPAFQFNRGHGIHDEPDGSPSPQPVESNYEDSNESEDEDDDIEFVSDETDVNDGVENEARLHSFDEVQLPSEALFLVGRRTRFGRTMRNRVSIDDDQRFECHILESADHPPGTATIEMHQSQQIKSNRCALQGLAEPSDLEILIKSDYIVRQDSLNGKGNLNSHTCFVTKFISERRHGLSEPPNPPKLYFMFRYKQRPCLLEGRNFLLACY